MNFSREQLENNYNFHALKDICIGLGGIPSNLKKAEIIDYILGLQDGSIQPKQKGQGRKRIDEKNKVYVEDGFDVVTLNENENISAPEHNVTAGTTATVSGTFEKSENHDHGFLRGDNFKMSSITDVYVSPPTVRSFKLKQGDFVTGEAVYGRDNNAPSLNKIFMLNGKPFSTDKQRVKFSDLEPCFPDSKLNLEINGENDIALREIDLFAPIGKGQRGLIVAPPKAGKTTLIKKIARAINENHKSVHLIVLLIGERPEEVTDFKRNVDCELIYSTFDEKPKNHVRICELAIEKAKRLVEEGTDVVVLLDSITKLTRAYNETLSSSGKTLSGGIDPIALQPAKSVFGSARNVDNGGSLTIIATALVDTGSKMDEVIYEEFKGTGNSEIILSRNLSDRRIFPAIDLYRSSTRREELLLSETELNAAYSVRRLLDGNSNAEIKLIDMLKQTETNAEFIKKVNALNN